MTGGKVDQKKTKVLMSHFLVARGTFGDIL